MDIQHMDIAPYIDHTLLKPITTTTDIHRLCDEAVEHHFAAVCIPPVFVQNAVKHLDNTDVKIATVIGFPFGYDPTNVKVEAAKVAFDNGAHEIDMVVNIAAVKSRKQNLVRNDIESVITIAKMNNKVVKVIVETALLNQKELKALCVICGEAGADYVKTSTGFNGGGGTPEDVRFLKQNLPPGVKIKASGGIRTREQAIELINAGAQRLGTSAGLQLIL